jgi:hypothetical protein
MAHLEEHEVQATGDGWWLYQGAVCGGRSVPKLLHFNSLFDPRDVGHSELPRSPVVGSLTGEVTKTRWR